MNKVFLSSVIGLVVAFYLVACSGGGGSGSSAPATPAQSNTISSGLKIFVTTSKHVGDFKNDPLIQGSTAMEKADTFCQKDTSKPNNSVYKALLVDGVNRDAVTLTNWVLKPNTIYYRPYDNVIISQTTSSAIFPVLYQDLTNSIHDRIDPSSNSDSLVLLNDTWTGLSDLSTFSSSGIYTCNGWSTGNNSAYATWGSIYEINKWSMSSAGSAAACDYKASLYCVEQP